MKRRVLVGILLVLCFAAPARAEVSAGVAAGLLDFRKGRMAEAYQAFSAAAVAGDAQAACFLGVMYDTGEGVRQDGAEAVEWYRRAAALGDPVAMFNVGVSYDAGNGVPRDHRAAAGWYGRAAALHHGRAEYDLALMYRSGDGVPRSPGEASRLFRAAAGDGIEAARAFLPQSALARSAPDHAGAPAGAVRGTVTHGVVGEDVALLQAQRALLSRQPREAATAAVLFRQAADAGGPGAALAMYDLAWCYENGIGVPADRSRAYALYVRAAAVTDDRGIRDLAESGAVGLRASSPAAAPPHP